MDKAVRLAMIGRIFEMHMHNRACEFENRRANLAKYWSQQKANKPFVDQVFGGENPHDFFFASRQAFKEEVVAFSNRECQGNFPQEVPVGGGKTEPVSLNHPEDAAFWRIVSLRYRLWLDQLDDSELRQIFSQKWEERKARNWSPMF